MFFCLGFFFFFPPQTDGAASCNVHAARNQRGFNSSEGFKRQQLSRVPLASLILRPPLLSDPRALLCLLCLSRPFLCPSVTRRDGTFRYQVPDAAARWRGGLERTREKDWERE